MKTFDICYAMAKESLGFRKSPALHELKESHGIDLGFTYKTDVSVKTFIHYIPEIRAKAQLSASNIYSFLMVGSMDEGER